MARSGFVSTGVRAIAWGGLVLAAGVAACGPKQPVTIAPGAPQQVVACYEQAYTKRHGKAPVLGPTAQADAERVLRAEDGDLEDACELIRGALRHRQCGQSATLEALAEDRFYCRTIARGGRGKHLNSSQQHELNQRIHQNQMDEVRR